MEDHSDERSAAGGSAPGPRRDEVPTVREIKKREEDANDTVPEQQGLYVAPHAPPGVSPHRTLDTRAVRIASDIDPRRVHTERRLEAPVRRRGRAGLWLSLGGAALLFVAGGLAWLELSRAEPNDAPRARQPSAPSAPPRSLAPSASPSPAGAAPAPSAAPAAPRSRQPEPVRPAPAPPKPANLAPAKKAPVRSEPSGEPAPPRRAPWIE